MIGIALDGGKVESRCDEYDPSQEIIDVLDSWEENDGSISKVVLLANGNVDIRTQKHEPRVSINVNSHTGYVDNLDDFPF